MVTFLAAYQEALGHVEAAVAAPQDSALRSKAEDSLEALRQAYKKLTPEEKDAARPMASLLSKRLSELQLPEVAKGTRKTVTLASAKKQGITEKEFAKAMLGGPEEFSLDQYASVPQQVFRGNPTPDALLEHFGYAGFREGQREAVEAALAGRDSLVIMPTGGGKSLCYQLAGMASPDLTVVVTPLVALMRDQFERLARDGHPAVMLAAGLSEDHNRDALRQISEGTVRMVFCAPERFASQSFVRALESRRIVLFVVDEAHCVSEWGHDFRPDYLRLHVAIEHLGRPPVMACTATATPIVAKEISSRLGLKKPLLVQGGFDRPNLSFDVFTFSGEGSMERKMQTLYAGLQMDENRPAIVYCGTRRDVEQVASRLGEAGLKAVAYHAGLATPVRTKAQGSFMSGESDIVVATNAFGMGVDKADVRSVWHWAIPTSVEAYYQEAGRAGRDGAPARAVLLAMRADLGRLVAFNKKRSTTLDAVQAYVDALSKAARGKKQLVIEQPENDEDRLALAIAERAHALSFAPASGGRLEVTLIGPLNRKVATDCCQIAKQRGWDAYRAVEHFSSTHDVCRRKQLLDHFGDKHPLHPEGRCCDVCDPPTWLPQVAEIPVVKKARKVKVSKASPATQGSGSPLLEALLLWRREVADGRPAYQVAKNVTLEEIDRLRPRTSLELLEIHGVGPKFLNKYGQTVLGMVTKYP